MMDVAGGSENVLRSLLEALHNMAECYKISCP